MQAIDYSSRIIKREYVASLFVIVANINMVVTCKTKQYIYTISVNVMPIMLTEEQRHEHFDPYQSTCSLACHETSSYRSLP